MSKKLMLGAALAALTLSMPLAQAADTASNSTPSTPAAANNAQAQPTGGPTDFVMSQKPDQWLASRFRGTDVVGPDSKSIGEVSDILFDKTGKIEAYVVSVGGFLGVGAKEVAIAPASFTVLPGKNGAADVLQLSASQNDLKQAENFKPYVPPRVTTGAAPGGSPLMHPPAGMQPPSTGH
jgi:sporulation protein YlmC with PRC-barrel domain